MECKHLIILGTLALVGCTDSQALQVQKLAQQGCGLIPAIADVTAALANSATATPLPGVFIQGTAPMAKAMCDQFTAKMHQHAAVDTGCAAIINGVCIHQSAKLGE